MRQYLEAKRQYRDAIVFFRMGDFYEMFCNYQRTHDLLFMCYFR